MRSIPLLEPDREIVLMNEARVMPDKFFGIHANHSFTNERMYQSVTASGTQGQNTITLSAVDAGITTGMRAVMSDSLGCIAGSAITNVAGTTVTLDAPNEASFTSKSVLIYGYRMVPAGQVIRDNPAVLGYDIFRTHDSRWPQWRDINPAPGVFYWEICDVIYDQLAQEGREILITLLGTPKWASARPLESGYAYGGTGYGAEPANMQHWVDFLVALAQRCRTRYKLIKYWEVWNEPAFQYREKTATGTSGQFTVTVSDNAGLSVGQTVTGAGVGPHAKIATGGISGNTITLTVANSGAVSGTLLFSGQVNHFFSGTEKSLAILTRLAAQVAAEYLPNVVVFSSPPSNIQARGVRKVSVGAVRSDGTTTTIERNTHGEAVGNQIIIQGCPTPLYNTPAGQVDTITSVTTNNFTIARALPAGLDRNCWYLGNQHLPVSKYMFGPCDGLAYNGDNGAGKCVADYVGGFAYHTYQQVNPNRQGWGNRHFEQLRFVKEAFELMGKSIVGKKFFTTEFGAYFVGDLQGTTCLVGATSVSVSGNPPANDLRHLTLKDTSDQPVGVIASNTTTTITLAEPAKVALTGTSRVFNEDEKVAVWVRFILTAIAAGFDAAFVYAWVPSIGGGLGIYDFPNVITRVRDTIANARGKTLICVTEIKKDGTCLFYFNDGTVISA